MARSEFVRKNAPFPSRSFPGGPASVGLPYLLFGLPYLLFGLPYLLFVKTANAEYPTPFGTPPGATQVGTVGTGYNGGEWQANLAYGYRFGHGAVTAADLNAPGRKPCQFCGTNGKDAYSIHLSGIYLDASYKF